MQLQNTFIWIDTLNHLSLHSFPKTNFSRSAGGTMSALVKDSAQANLLLLVLDFCSGWHIYQSAFFTLDMRSSLGCTEVDPRKEKFTLWLTLSKVISCFQGLQETSPGDLLI